MLISKQMNNMNYDYSTNIYFATMLSHGLVLLIFFPRKQNFICKLLATSSFFSFCCTLRLWLHFMRHEYYDFAIELGGKKQKKNKLRDKRDIYLRQDKTTATAKPRIRLHTIWAGQEEAKRDERRQFSRQCRKQKQRKGKTYKRQRSPHTFPFVTEQILLCHLGQSK